MKQHWGEQELAEHWLLTHEELEWVRNRTGRSRLGFAALLKFFQLEGRFPNERREIPTVALDYLAEQLGLSRTAFADYGLGSRSAKRDRGQIRELLRFRQATVRDGIELAAWLTSEVLPVDHRQDHLRDAALGWCRRNRIEPPTPTRLDRIIGSAFNTFQSKFFEASLAKIRLPCRAGLDQLLEATDDEGSVGEIERTPMAELRADPGRPSLESVLKEIVKMQCIAKVGLPDGVFEKVPPQVLQKYRLRAATEPPRELRRHPEPIRFTLLAAFCYQRRKEIVDGLVDLLIQVVHQIGVRSERKVMKTLLADLRKVHGKTTLLFRIAEVAVDNPNGVVKEVVYPVVGEQTLRDLVREHKSTGTAYEKEVHTTMRASYGNHYLPGTSRTREGESDDFPLPLP